MTAHLLVAGYGATDGSVLVDPSIELDNDQLRAEGPALGYQRTRAFGRSLGKINVGLGRVCLSGSADFHGQRVTRDVCGLTDASIRVGVDFVGARALSMQEYAGHHSSLIVGASLRLAAPVGQYDPDRLVNIGTHRWSAKAEIGVEKDLRLWTLDLAVSATFFEANDALYGGVRRVQQPLCALQAHMIRGVQSGLWIGIGTTYYRGGETLTDGCRGEDLIRCFMRAALEHLRQPGRRKAEGPALELSSAGSVTITPERRGVTLDYKPQLRRCGKASPCAGRVMACESRRRTSCCRAEPATPQARRS